MKRLIKKWKVVTKTFNIMLFILVLLEFSKDKNFKYGSSWKMNLQM